MSAPTTKVQNFIEEGMEVEYRADYTAYASGNILDGYSISLCKGAMPPFETRNFETIQDLADGMRELASLRNWKKTVIEQY